MSTSTGRKYKYTRLRNTTSFRLLMLHPGKGYDPLVCELHVHQLHSLHDDFRTPPFEAISYVWGSCETVHNIQCDGKPLGITENLRDALCRVRQPAHQIFIWADAICIDQSDQRERREQVNLMRTIFSMAKTVSVCLASKSTMPTKNQNFVARILMKLDTSNTQADLKLLKPAKAWRLYRPLNPAKAWRLYRLLKPARAWTLYRLLNAIALTLNGSFSLQQDQNQIYPSPNRTRPCTRENPDQIWSKQPLSNISPLFWSFLAEFFDNPWFSRIWVIQEVAESQSARVLYGDQEIPWRNIVRLAQWLLRDPSFGGRVLRMTKSNGIRNVLFMEKNVTISAYDPIPALLQLTRDFEASDPRDKVYAMLHKPIKRTRTYPKFRFVPPRKYIELFAQSISLLCLLSATFDSSPAEIHFWYVLISFGYLAYFLRFDRSVHAIIWDFCHRLANFCATVDRTVLRWYRITATIWSTLDISADYSLTTNSVYGMVTTRLIEQSRKLDVLSYINHGCAIDTMHPSWVPQWNVPTHGVQVLVALPHHQYQSSSGMYHRLDFSPQHPDHLLVEGVRFSTVSSISEVITSTYPRQSNSSTNRATTIDDVIWCYARAKYAYPTSESMRRVCMATLTAGRFAQASPGSAAYLGYTHQYNYAIAKLTSYGRRQFVTENGYMGIGPAAMRGRDIVCVLFGGCVPYILRATDTDGRYRLVGESYVHGIMQGEAINLWRQGRLTKGSFTLY